MRYQIYEAKSVKYDAQQRGVVMDKETTDILEKLLERKLDNEKKERLQRIQCPLPKKLVH